MAKKPKDIWDIVDTVNDVFGKGKRPSDEFYGGSLGDFKDAVKTAAQFSAQAANPVLESYARNVALPQAGGQKANWKRFAGEQAIGAAAIGGSLAASKAVESLAKSGVAARVANKMLGQEVYVHGSPTKGIKELRPMSPIPEEPGVVYGAKVTPPNIGNKSPMFPDVKTVYDTTGGYAQGVENYGKAPSGSLYVTKFKKKNLAFFNPKSKADTLFFKNADSVAINASKTPVKVVQEISKENKTKAQVIQELTLALKKAGAKVEPSLIDKLAMKSKLINKYQGSKLNKAFREEF